MPLSSKDELNALVKKAMDAFNQLTPEEKAAHRREQAISWAVGQTLMSRFEHGRPDLTEEEEKELRQRVADQYDHREVSKKDLSEP